MRVGQARETICQHMFLRFLPAFCILLLLPALLAAREPREQTRIDALLASVENLKGGVFIRNGSEYDAAKAASHLRLKLSSAGERVKTAEDFIVGLATGSSMTGRPYRIRLPSGKEEDAAVFFRARLAEIDQAKK